ncbi:hypothetical protein Tco_0496184 [Tanacetum coccineum]
MEKCRLRWSWYWNKPNKVLVMKSRRHGPSDAMHNPSQPLKASQKILVSFLMEIKHISIDFLTLTGTPCSTTIDQDAPSTSHSPSSSEVQPPILHQGVAARPTFKDNPFAQADSDPFVNPFALEPSSEESSLGDVSTAVSNQLIQPYDHLRKWTKDHPMDNVIGNPSRLVSIRKQLATDALWCFYHSVLSKVEPKNFKTAVTEPYWFEAMQEKIHEFD